MARPRRAPRRAARAKASGKRWAPPPPSPPPEPPPPPPPEPQPSAPSFGEQPSHEMWLVWNGLSKQEKLEVLQVDEVEVLAQFLITVMAPDAVLRLLDGVVSGDGGKHLDELVSQAHLDAVLDDPNLLSALSADFVRSILEQQPITTPITAPMNAVLRVWHMHLAQRHSSASASAQLLLFALWFVFTSPMITLRTAAFLLVLMLIIAASDLRTPLAAVVAATFPHDASVLPARVDAAELTARAFIAAMTLLSISYWSPVFALLAVVALLPMLVLLLARRHRREARSLAAIAVALLFIVRVIALYFAASSWTLLAATSALLFANITTAVVLIVAAGLHIALRVAAAIPAPPSITAFFAAAGAAALLRLLQFTWMCRSVLLLLLASVMPNAVNAMLTACVAMLPTAAVFITPLAADALLQIVFRVVTMMLRSVTNRLWSGSR